MIEVAGQVSSGSGVATSHILEFADELQEIVNDSLYPGSLLFTSSRSCRQSTCGLRWALVMATM
jgi:hypothetical protein